MALYPQICMVNTPSKSQLERAPISFTKSGNSSAQVCGKGILKRTTDPTLMDISYLGLSAQANKRTHSRRSSRL